MTEPTFEEIVKYVLEHEQDALRDLSTRSGSEGMPPRHRLFKDSAIEIMLNRRPKFGEEIFIGVDVATNSYALASKAYDTLLREREPPTLEDEVKRLGIHCTIRIDDSFEFRFRPEDDALNVDDLLIDNLGRTICDMFNPISRKPRRIVIPLIGVNYGALLNTKGKERLTEVLTTNTRKPYAVQKVTVELDTDELAKQYAGWQRPIGEVRVEFGMREE